MLYTAPFIFVKKYEFGDIFIFCILCFGVISFILK